MCRITATAPTVDVAMIAAAASALAATAIEADFPVAAAARVLVLPA
jgi:hypothetical protein